MDVKDPRRLLGTFLLTLILRSIEALLGSEQAAVEARGDYNEGQGLRNMNGKPMEMELIYF